MRAPIGTQITLGLGLVVICLAAGVSLTAAQSGSPAASPETASPAASPAASGAPETGPLGWTMDKKGEGFDKSPFFNDLAQAADGTVVMVGAVRSKKGYPTAAAWRTTDERVWTRVDWKTPALSQAPGIIWTPSGFIAVGGGTWTSPDGTAWTFQTVTDANFHDVARTAQGLVAIGQPIPGPTGVPTLWTATDATMMDATTWVPMPLGDTGIPTRVAVSPDGTIVVAGALLDGAGSSTPTVWRVSDGVIDTVALEGLAPVPTGIVDLRWTSAGFAMAVIQNDSGVQRASVWISANGLSWSRSLDVRKGAVTALGTLGPDIIAFANDRMWQTSDGLTWRQTREPAFKGYAITTDTQLADGRLLGAGTYYTGPTTSKAATFLGQVVLPPIE